MDTLLYKFVAFRAELTSVFLHLFSSQSLSKPSVTSPAKKGLSSMEPMGDLCCSLYKALTLDPVPVVGNMIYVAGAEGLSLSDLTEETVKPCPIHRFNLRHITDTLLRYASNNKRCCCESAGSKTVPFEESVYPFLDEAPEKDRVQIVTERGGTRDTSRSTRRRVLWAYEMDNMVAAYKWLIRNRSHNYPKCCEAVIVYQLRRSQSLPSGLYIYRTQPTHFGCTVERPLMVLDQFNFVSQTQHLGLNTGLPHAITIKMFPGRENFSVLYVINRNLAIRNLAISGPEYGNRMFGEAKALGMVDPCLSASSCEHEDVAMRTERMCVIDLRWKGFDTKSDCIKAIPKLKGLQALVWCNHSSDPTGIECKVLAWLFDIENQLPKEVHLIDYKREMLSVGYILMDMDTFPGSLPKPPTKKSTYFVHTYFAGDLRLATDGIGEVPEYRSRMGSPSRNNCFNFWYSLPTLGCCQPTPFSCGVRHEQVSEITDDFKTHLQEWVLGKDGTSCMGLAVQHTLYYHAVDMKYKLMVSHTVMNNDLNIFKL